MLRSSIRRRVELEGWEVREGFRGRLVATRANARVVLIGGLRPRAILYVDNKRQGRRPLHSRLGLDAWVQESIDEAERPEPSP